MRQGTDGPVAAVCWPASIGRHALLYPAISRLFRVVFAAYWAIPWPRLRVWLLLAASFYFYASWNHWLAAASSSARIARLRSSPAALDGKSRAERPAGRLLLLVSSASTSALLCYFKYANFFLDSLEDGARAAGASASLPVLQRDPAGRHLVLHVRGDQLHGRRLPRQDPGRAEPRPTSCCSSCSSRTWSPGRSSGPATSCRRSTGRKRWNWPRLQVGVQLFLLGLFKKLAIADRMALFADPVFADPDGYGTAASGWRSLAYAIQIYCDFSGYSDMALGPRPPARLQADDELQHAVPGGEHRPSSGGAGTSRCRPGSATTCSFRSAAAAARSCGPHSTCHRHDALRPVARGELDVCRVRPDQRRLPGRSSSVPHCHQGHGSAQHALAIGAGNALAGGDDLLCVQHGPGLFSGPEFRRGNQGI